MAASDFSNDKSLSDSARDAAGQAYSAAQDAGRRAAATAGDYRDAARDAVSDLGDAASRKGADLRAAAGDAYDTLKDRASQHAGEAQNLISNLASEARAKVSDIVDDQKNRGAEQLSGFSRAAHSAAGELEGQSPAVARLMHDAASTVDTLADDLRSADLRDVLGSVADFARRQPVAFFAASVLAGFVLARFVKSEPVSAVDRGTDTRRSFRA